MSEYREIITKAVVGKDGSSQSQRIHLPRQKPTSILGGWIINHKYEARKIGKNVEIEGTMM